MSATASPPTSDIGFRSLAGKEVAVPREWQQGLVILPAGVDQLTEISARVNGRHVTPQVQLLSGEPQVVLAWDRAGPGWYHIELGLGRESIERRFRIEPAKISGAAFESMLMDLEERLPVTIAIALKDAGARIGLDPVPPEDQTLATEVARLRRAVHGSGKPGLVEVLKRLSNDPHRLLSNVGEWVRSRDSRRPDPAGLVQAVWSPSNLEDGRPKRVLDRRVVHTVDLYENRLLKAFATEVERRLRRVSAVLDETAQGEVKAEVDQMLMSMSLVRRHASFLDEVGLLRSSPSRATMVLMKRMEYRAAYEGFIEFRRNRSVHLEEPAMEEPLNNLPYLYQLWCTLVVIDEVVATAAGQGWSVVGQRLVSPSRAGTYLDVLKDGRPAVTMKSASGRRLRLIPERSFARSGSPLGSVSFTQRPDISIEVTDSEGTRVLLLDPKYKLVSEDEGEPGDGTPKKTDVDKMHAYRDAIRDVGGRHAVEHAATLYPGKSVAYGADVSAIHSYPGEESEMRKRVRKLVEDLVGDG